MPEKKYDFIIETPTKAHQAEPDPSDLMLSVIGLGLAALILGGVWVLFFHP
jgi:hypothetical protein